MITKMIFSEEEMLSFGAKIANALKAGCVIYLVGPLGAGKTTLTRGLLRGFGYEGKVKSPTYTLVEPYSFNQQNIFHFDLYRLNRADELHDIGMDEYFSANTICLIEWPEKGAPILPPADLACYIEFNGEHRKIIMRGQTEKGEEILARMQAG